MWENMWTFETARFRVILDIAFDHGYQYDGDDEDGEVQRLLDCGEYVAFDSRVRVLLDGREIGAHYLGASVYAANDIREFWEAHRDSDPMNRNCSAMRAARGDNAVICHYFPDMVAQAVAEARKTIASMPRLRAA